MQGSYSDHIVSVYMLTSGSCQFNCSLRHYMCGHEAGDYWLFIGEMVEHYINVFSA